MLDADATVVYLAAQPQNPIERNSFVAYGRDHGHDGEVPLLVSYLYLQQKDGEMKTHDVPCSYWCMDSGGFTAWKSGDRIDLDKYADCCLRLLAEDPRLVEVMALDVVGNWRASWRNFVHLWKRGVPAIPIYHYGEPPELLADMRAAFPPKIALGGMAGVFGGVKKLRQLSELFELAWPARVHGLGVGSERAMLTLPFHSADASNWRQGAARYGRWQGLSPSKTSAQLKTRRMYNLASEVHLHQQLAARLRSRWQPTFREALKDAPPWPVRTWRMP